MRHALVRALVMHYLDHFGYKGAPPRVYTTPSRVERAGITIERGEYGSCTVEMGRRTIVFVNPGPHISLADLLDTCAHEALHVARPDMRHGNAFDAEVAEAVLA